MSCKQDHKLLTELSVSGRQLNWSKEIFAAKFNAAYKEIRDASRVEVGAAEIFSEKYFGRRWIHWEASAGRVCLREVWLDRDLIDHAICLKLGGGNLGSPSSVHFECINSLSVGRNEEMKIRVCFAMTDGSVHNLLLTSSDDGVSFLADIVDVKEGGMVESMECDYGPLTLQGLTCTHRLSDSSLKSQVVTSTCFLSHFAIVFGLSDGDVVYLRMSSGDDQVFIETVMRYTGVVQSLWSGLVGSATGEVTPKVVAMSGSHLRASSITIVYTADGYLSVWDCLSRNCLQKFQILDLLRDQFQGGGIAVEGVLLDTYPIDTESFCCLGIVLCVSTRVGRNRQWNNMLLSWLPSTPRNLHVRGRLAPPAHDVRTVLTTEVSLEQISLSPCCSNAQSVDLGEIIASLWRVGTEVIPVCYHLPHGVFSWVPHSNNREDVVYQPKTVLTGPSEKHSHQRLEDDVFAESVTVNHNVAKLSSEEVCRWNSFGEVVKSPSSSDFDVEIDMQYIRGTFLQRLFTPGRFPWHLIAKVITEDVPYDVQQLCAEGDDDWGYEELTEVLLSHGIETYIEEKDESMAGVLRSIGNGGELSSESKNISNPIEILVKAVLCVCNVYEEIVLDRLLMEEHHKEQIHLDAHVSTKLRSYRSHSPKLCLNAQIEVCQSVLKLCEDRLRCYRTGFQCCSLLVHTRGSSSSRLENRSNMNSNTDNATINVPFEFVVVRPTGMGVVVNTSFMSASCPSVIPSFSDGASITSFVPFHGEEQCASDQEQLLKAAGEEFYRRPRDFAAFEAVLTRYVADVNYFDVNQSCLHDELNSDGDGSDEERLRPILIDCTPTFEKIIGQTIGLSPDCAETFYDTILNSHSVAWNGTDEDFIRSADTFFSRLVELPNVISSEDVCGFFENPLRSMAGSELICDLCVYSNRNALVYYECVALIVTTLHHTLLVKDSGRHCSMLCALIQDKYLPLVAKIVLQNCFVAWTQGIYLSESRKLEGKVDFRDLAFNGSIIASLKESLPRYTNAVNRSENIFFDSESSSGALLSFWRQRSFSFPLSSQNGDNSHNFWENLGQQCLFSLRPSSLSDFMDFFLFLGQYSLATKLSSLATRHTRQSGLDACDSTLLQFFFETHAKAIQAISGIQMQLHDITSAVSGRPGAMSAMPLDPSNMEEIQDAVKIMIQMVVMPCGLEDKLSVRQNEWCVLEDSCISAHSGEGQFNLISNIVSSQDIIASIHEWTNTCLEGYNEESLQAYFGGLESDDEVFCLSEGLLKLADTSYFRVFFSAIQLMLQEYETKSGVRSPFTAIGIIIQCYPDILLQFYHVFLSLNFHQVVDRSRLLLPTSLGVDLALQTGMVAAENLEALHRNFNGMFRAWYIPSRGQGATQHRLVGSALYCVCKELETVLSSLYANILEISLNSCLLDKGYEAVLALIKLQHENSARKLFWTQKSAIDGDEPRVLEEKSAMDVENQDPFENADDTASLQWHGCLRSLIVKACGCGNLKWVCERNDVERIAVETLIVDDGSVSEYVDEKVVDMVKEIVKELEFVCNSSDFSDYFSSSDNVSNSQNSLHILALYDCLAAFMLSKNLHQSCSRLLYQLVKRLEVELLREAEYDEEFDALKILKPQIRALETAIGALHHESLSISQRYIVLRSAPDKSNNSDDKLELVTLAQMEHFYMQLQSKLSLVRSVAAGGGCLRYVSMDDEEVVRALCSQGNFYDAINLSLSTSNQSPVENPCGTSSIGRSKCLEHAIEVLAEACSHESNSLSTLEQFASVLGTNLKSVLEYEESLDAGILLKEYLVHCVQCLDGPDGNWSLHAAATRACLHVSSFESLSPTLIDSFCGFDRGNKCVDDSRLSSSINDFSGNISKLLEQLLESGYLMQACDIASKMLNSCNPENEIQTCVPYQVFDRIIDASSQVLEAESSIAGSSESELIKQVEGLKKSHGNLLSALEGYFNRLLVVDAGR